MNNHNNYHKQFLAIHAKKPTETAILMAGCNNIPSEIMSELVGNNDLFIDIKIKDDIISVEYIALASRCPWYDIQKYFKFAKLLMSDFDFYLIEWRFISNKYLVDYSTVKLPSSNNTLIF